MAQITEDFARRMIEAYRNGQHTPLTAWEECQLACAWLRAHGYRPPDSLDLPMVFAKIGPVRAADNGDEVSDGEN